MKKFEKPKAEFVNLKEDITTQQLDEDNKDKDINPTTSSDINI